MCTRKQGWIVFTQMRHQKGGIDENPFKVFF